MSDDSYAGDQLTLNEMHEIHLTCAAARRAMAKLQPTHSPDHEAAAERHDLQAAHYLAEMERPLPELDVTAAFPLAGGTDTPPVPSVLDEEGGLST